MQVRRSFYLHLSVVKGEGEIPGYSPPSHGNPRDGLLRDAAPPRGPRLRQEPRPAAAAGAAAAPQEGQGGPTPGVLVRTFELRGGFIFFSQPFLSPVQLFIGFGFPYEGPAPLEAIANGCIFLQPRFDPPHSSLNHEFFRGKPTSRKVRPLRPCCLVPTQSGSKLRRLVCPVEFIFVVMRCKRQKLPQEWLFRRRSMAF